MIGWTPNDDGVEHWPGREDVFEGYGDQDSTAPQDHNDHHRREAEAQLASFVATWVDGKPELTLPLDMSDYERALVQSHFSTHHGNLHHEDCPECRKEMDASYDAACGCMNDVYAGQKRVRTYKSLPESDVWRDEGAGG